MLRMSSIVYAAPRQALLSFLLVCSPETEGGPGISLRKQGTITEVSCKNSTGTTRDNFGGKVVKELQYSSYGQLALRTMMSICQATLQKHSLTSIAMIHRLGTVPIAEESILIAVSSPHRQAAWRAGEEALEECKARVEVWKKEEFEGEDGVWRANRDGAAGQKLTEEEIKADRKQDMAP